MKGSFFFGRAHLCPAFMFFVDFTGRIRYNIVSDIMR